MTCCDAMRKTMANYHTEPLRALRDPMRFIQITDGTPRCRLCGAEWGPVKVADETAERAKE